MHVEVKGQEAWERELNSDLFAVGHKDDDIDVFSIMFQKSPDSACSHPVTTETESEDTHELQCELLPLVGNHGDRS